MTTAVNLKDDLSSYLSRNEKPPVATQLKQSISNNKFIKLLGNQSSNGYSPVPGSEASTSYSGWFRQEQPKSSCFTLSRMQRIIAFSICISLGLIFFTISGFYIPFLLLKARKFSLLFTIGSLFMLFSFSFLWGPKNHFLHLFSKERWMFTCSYFVTLFGTLYFAMGLQSTPLTIVFAVLQIFALIWFLVSYIPGGHQGMKFFTQLCASSVRNSVSRTLPV